LLQGESQARLPGGRQPGGQRRGDHARTPPGRPDAARRAVRRQPVGDGGRHQAEHEGQHEHAGPEHGPVDVDAWCLYYLPHRPEQGQRRQADGYRRREQRPGHGGAHDAEQPVRHRCRRGGAQRAQHLGLAGAGVELAGDGLGPDDQRGDQRDHPEHGEGDGLGADGLLRLGLDGRGVVDDELAVAVGRVVDEPLVLLLDGNVAAAAAVKLQAVVAVGGAAGLVFPQQRGGAHQEPGPVGVDVVVHELDAEHADPHDRQVGLPVQVRARGVVPLQDPDRDA
jgi:hypothetical protein